MIDWQPADTYRELTFLAVDAADYAQTRTIARNPNHYIEYNTFLSPHPSISRVGAFFAAGAILHLGTSVILPAAWRPGFQYLSIGFEAAVVTHNSHIGIKMEF